MLFRGIILTFLLGPSLHHLHVSPQVGVVVTWKIKLDLPQHFDHILKKYTPRKNTQIRLLILLMDDGNE